MSISITIDNLDSVVAEQLEAEARRRGLDVEAVVKELLREALERTGRPMANSTQHELDRLAGTWSDDDAKEFFSATRDFSQVDEDLWK